LTRHNPGWSVLQDPLDQISKDERLFPPSQLSITNRALHIMLFAAGSPVPGPESLVQLHPPHDPRILRGSFQAFLRAGAMQLYVTTRLLFHESAGLGALGSAEIAKPKDGKGVLVNQKLLLGLFTCQANPQCLAGNGSLQHH
jgi:hypothetical protein